MSRVHSVVTYLHSHYWRAVRTAIQTFAAVIVAAWLSSGTTSHGILALYDVFVANWNDAAGTAFLAFLAALGWKPGLVGGKGDPQDPSLQPSTPQHPIPGGAHAP